jgi:hypothetical protein
MESKKTLVWRKKIFPGVPRPITWQGYLISLMLVELIIFDIKNIGMNNTLGIVIFISILVAYIVVVKITSGTAWSWGSLINREKK